MVTNVCYSFDACEESPPDALKESLNLVIICV